MGRGCGDPLAPRLIRTAGLIHYQSGQHIYCWARDKFTVAPTELEEYLHEQIPMSKAMQVSVVEVKPKSQLVSLIDQYVH